MAAALSPRAVWTTQLGDRFMSTRIFTTGATELPFPLPARPRRTRPCPLPSRVLTENLVARAACGDEPDDGSDGDPHPADAWLSPHYGGVTGDAGQLWHGGLTPVVNVSIVGHPQPQAKSKPPSSQNTRDEILREYPYLEAKDIAEALSYAAWRAEEVEVPLRQP